MRSEAGQGEQPVPRVLVSVGGWGVGGEENQGAVV